MTIRGVEPLFTHSYLQIQASVYHEHLTRHVCVVRHKEHRLCDLLCVWRLVGYAQLYCVPLLCRSARGQSLVAPLAVAHR